jgi:signal transduction histidine kinase
MSGPNGARAVSSLADVREPTDEELSESYRIYLRVRGLTVLLPAAFVLVLLLVTVLLLDRMLPAAPAIGVAFAMASVAVALFSRQVFALIEPLRQGMLAQNAELRLRTAQLRAVHEAGVNISDDLSLAAVLQKVVDTSRGVVGARYGALAVVGESGSIDAFITSGFTAEESRLSGMPQGRGLIGHVIETGRPYRTSDIASDPNSCGFPPGHPEMTSFLGVPLLHKGKAVGNLYLTDKETGEFTEQDQDAIQAFAVQAAVAIENARLYSEVQDVAVLRERERIGMELHDGTIQAIYGVGLKLEDCIQRVGSEPEAVREDLDEAIEALNRIILEIRNYIFDLRPLHSDGNDLLSALQELVREARVNTLIDTVVNIHPGVDEEALPEEHVWHLLQIAREALTNIRKHSQASVLTVDVYKEDDRLVLTIGDNGRGLKGTPSKRAKGQGITNMNERVEAMQGRLKIESSPGSGTVVRVEVPLLAGATP